MKQEGAILLFDTKGEIRRLPIEHADRFEVYQLGSMGLTKGDRLRITENGRALDGKYRLNNGKLFTLAGFTREGDLRLDNGKIVPRAYGHLDYGYCVTSYAAQGKTVDEVILALSENASGAINTREFYVDASRGKHRLIAFTDDKAYLRQAVQRPAERRLATEVWPEHLSRHQNLIHLEAYMRQREINPSRPIASPPNPLNPSVQSHLRQRKDRSRGIAPA